MILAATFDNWPSSEVKPPPGSRCPVRIVALEDVRRSPEMIGIYDRRPIYAPQDRAAWLKSIVRALDSRGIDVAYEGDPSPPGAAAAKLDLTTAWINNTSANVSASAVFKMRVTNANGETTEAFYRGGNSRMPYWGTGPNWLQKAMDVAFAKALDAMATELLKTCAA
ncbi:MAG TPA: hypothetical protein VF079_01740 [Sphingomicrobium sp.]